MQLKRSTLLPPRSYLNTSVMQSLHLMLWTSVRIIHLHAVNTLSCRCCLVAPCMSHNSKHMIQLGLEVHVVAKQQVHVQQQWSTNAQVRWIAAKRSIHAFPYGCSDHLLDELPVLLFAHGPEEVIPCVNALHLLHVHRHGLCGHGRYTGRRQLFSTIRGCKGQDFIHSISIAIAAALARALAHAFIAAADFPGGGPHSYANDKADKVLASVAREGGENPLSSIGIADCICNSVLKPS